ncbi:MAG: hypothetical protein Q8P84_02075 [Deltaproteobacteria bacterium]|nr:hypothetical protein [Deltaproteobacteria bacterium]MDZ4224350.1 hypothetical protein [bacterium]
MKGKTLGGEMEEEVKELEEELDFDDENEKVCPNCGQFCEGENVCPHCGAMLAEEDDELEGFHEDEEV